MKLPKIPDLPDEVRNFKPDASKIDFSQWHPLDHWPFTSRCRSFHGGGRHHIKITWEFRRKDDLHRPLCKLGRHRYAWIWQRDRIDGVMSDWEAVLRCRHCWKPY